MPQLRTAPDRPLPAPPAGFAGAARPLAPTDIAATAAALDCEEAAIHAVLAVESRGGFDARGRPRILFERHYFHRLTDGRFAARAPDLSQPRWGGYGPRSAQYARLARAIALDRAAALRSASWGAFQIMGDNHRACGFAAVEPFVAAMCESEAAHLAAFAAFVDARGLTDALRRGAWAVFARGYNGPAYARNRYHTRLAQAYHAARAALAGDGPSTSAPPALPPPILAQGSTGAAVRRLQAALGVAVDGAFGPATHAALIAFQRARGLAVDGIAGAASWAALAPPG